MQCSDYEHKDDKKAGLFDGFCMPLKSLRSSDGVHAHRFRSRFGLGFRRFFRRAAILRDGYACALSII